MRLVVDTRKLNLSIREVKMWKELILSVVAFMKFQSSSLCVTIFKSNSCKIGLCVYNTSNILPDIFVGYTSPPNKKEFCKTIIHEVLHLTKYSSRAGALFKSVEYDILEETIEAETGHIYKKWQKERGKTCLDKD